MRSTATTVSMRCRLALLMMLVLGCASDHPAAPPVAEPTAAPKMATSKRMISDILIIKTADSVTVVVKGDQPLAYSVMEQDSPRTLVITFADTDFDRLGPFFTPPENMAVHSIRTEQVYENGAKARVILELKGGLPYRLVPEENSLKVVFSKATAPASGAASRQSQQARKQRPPAPAASGVLQEVRVVSEGGGVAVHMRVDGSVKDYKTFTIDAPAPAKIVLDLMGLRSAFSGEQKIPGDGNIVTRVRHSDHPDKVRVVVETEKAYLKKFLVEPVENGMVLKIGISTGKEN
jgi:hypothetical protein